MKMYQIFLKGYDRPLVGYGYFPSRNEAEKAILDIFGRERFSQFQVHEAEVSAESTGANWEKRTWDMAVKLFNLYKDMDMDSAILTAKSFVKRYLEMADEAKEQRERKETLCS